jgi:hypothetical protein
MDATANTTSPDLCDKKDASGSQLPQSLPDLKRNPTVLEIYRAKLEAFRRNGHEYIGRCPYHDDKNPSLTVYKDGKGHYRHRCFPCGASGDVFDLIQKVDNAPLQEAIRFVREFVSHNGSKMPEIEAKPSEFTPLQRAQARQNAERLREALDNMFFATEKENAQDSSGAIALLRSRGVGEEVRDLAELGFLSDANFGGVRGPAIAFPVLWKGEVIGLKFRAVNPSDKAHKWTQADGSKSDILYGCEWPDANDSGVVVIFEGNFDTLLGHSLGENAVGFLGVNSVPRKPSARFLESADLVKKRATHGVLIVGDSDEAGEDAKARLRVYFQDAAVTAVPKPFKDFSEFWQAEPNEAEEWLRLERQRAEDERAKRYPVEVWDGSVYGHFAKVSSQGNYLPQEFSIEALMTFAGAAVGDRLRLEGSDIGPRFFTVLMAGPGIGKGTSIGWAREVFTDEHEHDLVWSDANYTPFTQHVGACELQGASEPGLLAGFNNHLKIISVYEEVSTLVEKFKVEASGQSFAAMIRTLFDSDKINATLTGKRTKVAHRGLLSILGGTTPDLWSSMFAGKGAEGSGLFERINLISSDETRTVANLAKPDLTSIRVEMRHRLSQLENEPHTVRVAPEARTILEVWWAALPKEKDVTGRLNVQVLKKAMHMSWLSEPAESSESVITPAIMRRCIRLAEYERRVRLAHRPVVGDSPWAVMENKLEALVRARGHINEREAFRATNAHRVGRKIFDSAVAKLVEHGLVRREVSGTMSGQKRRTLTWVG